MADTRPRPGASAVPRLQLTADELARAFPADRHPGLLTTEQAAALLNVPIGTLRWWKATKRLEGTYRKRGRRNFYLRDRLLGTHLGGADWPRSPAAGPRITPTKESG